MLVLTSTQKDDVQASIAMGDIFEQYERDIHQDALAAEELQITQTADSARLLSTINQFGLTRGVYSLIDPQNILLMRITGNADATWDSVSPQVQAQLDTIVKSTLANQLPAGMSEEGFREAIHSEKVRKWTGGLVSFFYMPKTAAQKAAGVATAKATASGLAVDKIAAEKAVAAAKQGFFRGLFRAMIIGTIVDVAVESGMKIIDKVVNAGRVYGSAAQVQANIKSIQAILAKIKEAADLKVAVDGSNVDAINQKSKQILADIEKLYHDTPAYTMTLGKETGWTVALLQSTGKTYDQTVKNTDALSQAVANAAQGEIVAMTDDKGTPNPAVKSAVKERNHTVSKGIRLVQKLVTPTTRVFTELTKHIDTKGASTVMKTDASKGDAASKDDATKS